MTNENKHSHDSNANAGPHCMCCGTHTVAGMVVSLGSRDPRKNQLLCHDCMQHPQTNVWIFTVVPYGEVVLPPAQHRDQLQVWELVGQDFGASNVRAIWRCRVFLRPSEHGGFTYEPPAPAACWACGVPIPRPGRAFCNVERGPGFTCVLPAGHAGKHQISHGGTEFESPEPHHPAPRRCRSEHLYNRCELVDGHGGRHRSNIGVEWQ